MKEVIAADIDGWKHTEENQEELKQKKEKKVKRSIAIVIAVALIAVLAVSSTALAARPPNVPPITPAAGIVLESGSGFFVVNGEEPEGFMFADRGWHDIQFGPYDEVRHVSVTAVIHNGSSVGDPSIAIAVDFGEGIGWKLLAGEYLGSQERLERVTLEFDAKEWRITATSRVYDPDSGYANSVVQYYYTETYSSD